MPAINNLIQKEFKIGFCKVVIKVLIMEHNHQSKTLIEHCLASGELKFMSANRFSMH